MVLRRQQFVSLFSSRRLLLAVCLLAALLPETEPFMLLLNRPPTTSEPQHAQPQQQIRRPSQRPNPFAFGTLTDKKSKRAETTVAVAEDDEEMLGTRHATPSLFMKLPDPEDVCEYKVLRDHRPVIGHSATNGSRVEILQAGEIGLIATFVECASRERQECRGIDHKKFASECVTTFHTKPAMIRALGSTAPFEPGHVRVPINCHCRIRRLLHL